MRKRVGRHRSSFQCRGNIKAMLSSVIVSLCLVVALATSAVQIAIAQEVSTADIRVDLSSDHSELTVGEIATLSLVVSHPVSLTIVIPRLERNWGQFEVQDQTAVQTISEIDGTRTIAKQFRVKLFAPGNFQTPDLPMYIRHSDGSLEEIHYTPLRLMVNSVLSGPDEQLKDLRPPASISSSFWSQPYAIAFVAVLAVSILAGCGFFLYRRSQPRLAKSKAQVDTRSAQVIAAEELQRIERLDLPAGGNLKEHYTLITAALKAYLGATWLKDRDQYEVGEMTTEQTRTALERVSIENGSTQLAIELLEEGDLVKFANYAPPASRAYEATVQALSFVRERGTQQDPISPAKGAHPSGGRV